MTSGDNLVMEKEKSDTKITNNIKAPEPLPSGWGMQRLPSGRILFVDNKNPDDAVDEEEEAYKLQNKVQKTRESFLPMSSTFSINQCY